jgi:hypothetical protein
MKKRNKFSTNTTINFVFLEKKTTSAIKKYSKVTQKILYYSLIYYERKTWLSKKIWLIRQVNEAEKSSKQFESTRHFFLLTCALRLSNMPSWYGSKDSLNARN